MEKLNRALCQWTVLYTNCFNIKFSYLRKLYKTNNIKTKPGTKVKTYFKIQHNKETDKCSTLDPHGA